MSFTPITQVPVGYVPVTPKGFPAQVADGATYNSDLLPANGPLAVGLTSDHAATLNVQRYADLNGSTPVGALLTAALSANTPGYVSAEDGMPYLSYNVQIVNSGGAVANITAASIVTGKGPS